MKKNTPDCIGILGPTASGKSCIAMHLAEMLNGEIVSCDSMQLYRGLNIGTAKPTWEERLRVPHHLIDTLDISEPYNASLFVQDAEKAVARIQAQGRLPIVTGGTGLYAKAFFHGLADRPSDKKIAGEILTRYEQLGRGGAMAEFTQELRQAWPDPPPDTLRNPRHLMRAVEILRITGDAELLRKPSRQEPRPKSRQFIIMPPEDEHRQRIEARTKQMLDDGWIQEARELEARGLSTTPTARQALGYREIIEYLQGRIPDDQHSLRAIIITKTLQYARRQRTWFRHQHPGASLITHRHGVAMRELSQAIASQL